MTDECVAAMGRKIDLSGLTDKEAEHVLQVVQRDMRLRKNEEERLSELKQELDEEDSRCLLLSRQSCFNQRCCIRCCSSFTFLLNPKRRCCDCRYNICKSCRSYSQRDKSWLCAACQRTRLLKTQSLDWFYTNVKKRFKRFGSAKVLKTLYRKHLAEHSALSELTEGSACEESICNEGSICESDSTFYRQSEEHSPAEMLTVALRVAEEAIDEAISKAEFDTVSQEKQNEAHYLREHRGELTEELAKTIVQKIIHRRKTLAEMRTKLDEDWPLEQHAARPQSSSSLTHSSGLWRSHSAFSLSADGPAGLTLDSSQTLKKEGSGLAMSAWRSVDRLDNAGVSSALKSPDGNWIALQSAQLSRPSLLTKRKSLVFSALERESGVVSAYEGMDSDSETKPELHASWGAVLQEISRQMMDTNLNLQDTQDRILPMPTEVVSDSEGNWRLNKPLLAFLKKKLPAELRRPSCSPRTSIIDMNFNTELAEDEKHSSFCAEPEVGIVRRSRKKRKSKKEREQDSNQASDHTCDAVAPVIPDTFDQESLTEEQQQQAVDPASDLSAREEELVVQSLERRRGSQGEGNKKLWEMEEKGGEDEKEQEEDEDMKDRLYRLVAQSRLTYFSSTDEELDKVGQGEEKWEEDVEEDEEKETFTFRLCYLGKGVEASQLSSTEDELDVRVDEEDEEEAVLWKFEAGKSVRAAQLRDLACLVSNSQFSSTEDELDRVGDGREGVKGGGRESSTDMWGREAKRRESLGDLDVEMFDLMGGEDKVSDVHPEQKDFSEETDDESVGDEAKEAKGEEETQEPEPPDEKEGGQKFGDGKESPIMWETTEDAAEENGEFDRIISSMLMMTLDDMQVEKLKYEDAENTRKSRELKDGEASEKAKAVEESRREERAVGEESTKESEETGGGEEFLREGDESPESRKLNERQEKKKNFAEDKLGTNEAEDTSEEEEEEMDGRAETVSVRTDASNESTTRPDAVEPSSMCSLSAEEIQKVSDEELCKSVEFISTLLQQRYSAVSLRSITTEVLKVLNATEGLLQGAEGADRAPPPAAPLPPDSDPTKLDQQFSTLEENVYVAAGSVFSLEAELSDLEECARGICSSTSETELSFLEEQVASAAAKVQQSELQIRDISARIAALKSAGLDVDTQSRFPKTRNIPVMPATLDSSRQLRRRLPAPPAKEEKQTHSLLPAPQQPAGHF